MNISEIAVPTDVAELHDLIVRDCQPYLREVNYHPSGNLLFRGMHENTNPKVPKTARLSDRRPVNSPEYFHYMLNRVLSAKFGHPFRNGVFCNGHFPRAKQYGNPHAIFPIGEFDFLWSPHIEDLYAEFESRVEYVMDQEYQHAIETAIEMGEVDPDSVYDMDIDMDFDMVEVNDMAAKYIVDDIENDYIKYTTHDLIEASSSGKEIMLWCEKFYALPERLFSKLRNMQFGRNP